MANWQTNKPMCNEGNLGEILATTVYTPGRLTLVLHCQVQDAVQMFKKRSVMFVVQQISDLIVYLNNITLH